MKVAIMMNAPQLGGAERSMVHQAKLFNATYQVDFFIPVISNSDTTELEKFILENGPGNAKIKTYSYPRALYCISRSGTGFNFFSALAGMGILLYRMLLMGLSSYQLIWCNGNKAAFPSFVYSLLTGYRGRLVWHFRDYPGDRGLFARLWTLFKFYRRFDLSLLGNSHSVLSELEKLDGADEYECLYNPVGESLPMHEAGKEINRLGIVSMLSPWKGLHWIILWSSLYQNELKELGIKKISIFGGNIYKTDGAHQSYATQLGVLLDKFPNDLLVFEGRQGPAEIFSSIDLLIHPSVQPEPFGRVITEAFSCRIPVISTGLGGAGELIADGAGIKICPYDNTELFDAVRLLCQDQEKRIKLEQCAETKLKNIHDNIQRGLSRLKVT